MIKRRKKVKQAEPVPPMTAEERFSQMQKMTLLLERMRIADYVNNFNRPWRLLWLNILSGIGKGVGLTIGATLVIAIIFKGISALISMNIPYLTDVLQDVVQIVKATPGLDKMHAVSVVETQVGDKQVDVIVQNTEVNQNGTKSN